MTQNRATAIRPEAIQSDYRDFKLSFEYGYYTAIHQDYDCDWQGDEDGWDEDYTAIGEDGRWEYAA